MSDPLNSPNLSDIMHYTEVQVQKGELILRPYDTNTACYIVLNGRVKVYGIRKNGDIDTKFIYGTGELFPLTWILGTPSFKVYYEALTDCTLAKISQEALLDAARTNLQVSNALLHKVTQQYALYAARVDNLSYKYARERLAHRLLYLGAQLGELSPDNRTIMLPPVSQHDLGNTINLSRESVNRELNRFERLGAINVASKRITLLQPDILRKELGDDAPLVS